jgi:hypothetical protein
VAAADHAHRRTASSAIDGVTVTAGSTFSVDAGQSISLTGDLISTGTVLIGNSGGTADLVVDAPTVYLSGSGTIDLIGSHTSR